MKIAKRITKFCITLDGPHTDELFHASYNAPGGFDIVVVGSGDSRKSAVDNAIAGLKSHNVGPILLDITRRAYSNLSPTAHRPEVVPGTYMWCALALSVER